MKYKIDKILEFDDLFPNEELDINTILRKYSKEKIVRIVNCLGMNFGNAYIPDPHSTFFSEVSKKHITLLNSLIGNYLKAHNIHRVCYCTLRSILELLRYAFSIPLDQYSNIANNEDLEFDIFRVLLYINQDLMDFSSEDDDNSSKLIFLHNYVLNDITNGRWDITYQTQTYYFECISSFLKENETGIQLKDAFVKEAKFLSFEQYIQTLVALIFLYIDKKKENLKGCPILYLDKIKDETGFLHKEVCDYLSIDISKEISYSSEDDYNRKNNVDYREFRAHPLIKVAEDEYYIYNLQLLCERIYNSLFFDLKSVWSNRDGDYFQFYNKEVVEHFMFQRTMLSCLGNKTSYFYPPQEDILLPKAKEEQEDQPDFYIREKDSLILFECKGVKINGSIKDKADADELISVIRNKLYLSTENIDKKRKAKQKEETVGVTQLVKLINLIEDDIFQWDKEMPDAVGYYPVLVLEDPRLAQMGMIQLINDWYKPLLIEQKLTDATCHPIIVMSIDTLFRYSEVFTRKGFHNVFDEFFRTNVNNHSSATKWEIDLFADFDMYMRQKYKLSTTKKKYYMDIIGRISNKRTS